MTTDPLIINIDTAMDNAFVSLSIGGTMLDVISGTEQKEHAVILHDGIKLMLQNLGTGIKSVTAVAVTAGPGSYTGLRVGMAAAKGLCYALNIPLIAISTLELLTHNALSLLDQEYDRYCPMIDARRLEVFTALYDKDIRVISNPAALILNNESFNEELETNRIIFFGNGSSKFLALTNHSNAIFSSVTMIPQTMCKLSFEMYIKGNFSNIVSAAPLYIKEFNTFSKSP